MARGVSQAETAFWLHLRGGPFRTGEAKGRWRLISMDWPHATFVVRAADSREFAFRFDCTGYPRVPVTACPWNVESDTPLDRSRWPSGRVRLRDAFNPSWRPDAIYLPCDREAIQGHQSWVHQHPSLSWDPSIGIVCYLRVLSDLLNSGDFQGVRGDSRAS